MNKVSHHHLARAKLDSATLSRVCAHLSLSLSHIYTYNAEAKLCAREYKFRRRALIVV